MSMNARTQIVYGIEFPEDYQFPWDVRDSIEDWWVYDVMEYKNPVELYTEEGDYLNGTEPTNEQRKLYYDSKREFFNEHPCPVKLEYFGSYQSSQIIVSVKDVGIMAGSWQPSPINESGLKISDEKIKALKYFIKEHCTPLNDYDEMPDSNEAGWLLSCYYG